MRMTVLGERRILNHWEKEIMAVLRSFQEEQGVTGVRYFCRALTGQDDDLPHTPLAIFKGASVKDRMTAGHHKSIQTRATILLSERAAVSKSVNWLEIAIDLFGTQAAAAKALNVTPAYISKWLRQRAGVRNIPYRHVEALSDLTGVPMRLIGSVGKDVTARRAKAV